MKTIPTLVSIFALVLSASIYAHHGLDAYDTRQTITLHGQVVGYKLQDPHSLLFVDVTNADGSITHWTVEGGSGSGIAKSGISRKKLDNHPKVIVHGYAGRNNTCQQDCIASGLDFIFE